MEIKKAFLLTIIVWIVSAGLVLAQTADPEAGDSAPDTAAAEASEPEPTPEPISDGIALGQCQAGNEDAAGIAYNFQFRGRIGRVCADTDILSFKLDRGKEKKYNDDGNGVAEVRI